MAQRLKSWESPRRRGRNDKGKGGAARRRQIKKQQNMLRRKLKLESSRKNNNQNKNKTNKTREEGKLILFLSSLSVFREKTLTFSDGMNHGQQFWFFPGIIVLADVA